MQEPESKINGFCVSGLVLGLLTIPIVFIINALPYLGVLKIVGFAGIAVNLIALLTFKRDKQRGMILAIVGLVLSVAFVILSQTAWLTRDYI